MHAHNCSDAPRTCLGNSGRICRHLGALLIAVSFSGPAFTQAKAAPDSVESEPADDLVTPASTPHITVSVFPAAVSVKTGGSLIVNAGVENDSRNKGVTWALTGVDCSNHSCGTLTNVSPFSVTYVAPAAAPHPAVVTLTAASNANNTSSTMTTIMVASDSRSMWISPAGATVRTDQLRQFTAIVPENFDAMVSWEVNRIPGGDSTAGTISNSGQYRAPATIPSSGTVNVTAVSQADGAISASVTAAVTTARDLPSPLHGVTVADFDFAGNATDIRTPTYMNKLLPSLNNFSVTPTARITYTLEVAAGGGEGAVAGTYLSAMQTLKQQTRPPFILGEVVDSSYMGCFTVANHDARWNDYVSTLGAYVDLWEVGNEINGNWLDSTDSSSKISCPWKTPKTTDADVITKMIDAYNIVKGAGQLAELTLYYPGAGSGCDSPAKFDPITWATANVPMSMKNGLDYVLVSYYHQDCPSGTNPSPSVWGSFFTQVQNLFPNAKIGFGEWGYSTSKPSTSALKTLLNQGYTMDPSSLPVPANWVSGVFYWEYEGDAVPYNGSSGSIWTAINNDMQLQP